MKKNNNRMQYKIKLRIPAFFAMIAALVLFIAFFFPYISAADSYAEFLKLEDIKDEPIDTYTDLTYGDMVNVSLFEMTKYYIQENNALEDDIWSVLLLSAIAICALIILLSAKCRWPFLIILFAGIAALDFYFLSEHFTENALIAAGDWVRGMAYPVFYPAAGLAAFNGLWMLLSKNHIKKQRTSRKKR